MRTYNIKGHEQYLYVDENYQFYSHDRITTYYRKGKYITKHTKGRKLGYQMLGGHGVKYPAVSYLLEGKNVHVLCHKVIAETFIPNPNNLPCVNHKDGDKMNWSPSNLEWCTYSENTQHAIDNNLWKPYNSKLSYQDAEDIRNSKLSPIELADKYGVDKSNIYRILNNQAYKSKGSDNNVVR